MALTSRNKAPRFRVKKLLVGRGTARRAVYEVTAQVGTGRKRALSIAAELNEYFIKQTWTDFICTAYHCGQAAYVDKHGAWCANENCRAFLGQPAGDLQAK